MKKTSLAAFLAAIVMVSGLGMPAFAQPGRNVDERIEQMDRRIDRGLRDGSLNRREARDLRGELSRISDREARMRADGRLNPRERERLQNDLDRLERHIWREKRDSR